MVNSITTTLKNTQKPSFKTSSTNESSPQVDEVGTLAKTANSSKKIFESSTFWSRFLGIKFLPTRIYEKMANLKKKIFYRVSLIYTLFRNKLNIRTQPWYSDIVDTNRGIENIVLGGIPLKGHFDELTTKGINCVLSLLEDFEYQKTFFSTPVTENDWSSKNIDQKKIEATDFHPLTIKQIEDAVKFLDNKIKAGKKVYVHCKAGKGRSVMVVCCYLIKHRNMSANDAINFVKSKRPNIRLNKFQRARIYEYEQNDQSKNQILHA